MAQYDKKKYELFSSFLQKNTLNPKEVKRLDQKHVAGNGIYKCIIPEQAFYEISCPLDS